MQSTVQKFQRRRRQRQKKNIQDVFEHQTPKHALNGLLPSELANNQIYTCTYLFFFFVFSAVDRGVYCIPLSFCSRAFYFWNFAIINGICIAANMRRTKTTVLKYVQYLPKLRSNAFPHCNWRWDGTQWHFWWSAMPTILFHSHLIGTCIAYSFLWDFTCFTFTHCKDHSSTHVDVDNNGDDVDHCMWIAHWDTISTISFVY